MFVHPGRARYAFAQGETRRIQSGRRTPLLKPFAGLAHERDGIREDVGHHGPELL
jgi:hypothetical protein